MPGDPARTLFDADAEHLANEIEHPGGDRVERQVRPQRVAIRAERAGQGVDRAVLVPLPVLVALELVGEHGRRRVAERGRRGCRRARQLSERRPGAVHGSQRPVERAHVRPRAEPGEARDLASGAEQLAHGLQRGVERAVVQRAPEALPHVATTDVGQERVARAVLDAHSQGARRRARLEPCEALRREALELVAGQLEDREVVGERLRDRDRELRGARLEALERRAAVGIEVRAVRPGAGVPEGERACVGCGELEASIPSSAANRSVRAKVADRQALEPGLRNRRRLADVGIRVHGPQAPVRPDPRARTRGETEVVGGPRTRQATAATAASISASASASWRSRLGPRLGRDPGVRLHAQRAASSSQPAATQSSAKRSSAPSSSADLRAAS